MTTSAVAVALVSLVPTTAAEAADATLPAGTSLNNTITSPGNGATVPTAGDVTVTGTGEVGTTPAANAKSHLIYVIDRSGSTDDTAGTNAATFCPGGPNPDNNPNGDGKANTILDCEIAAALQLNQQAIAAGTVEKVAVVTFDTAAATVRPLIDPTDPSVVTALKGITVGGSTNFQLGVRQACNAADATAPTTIVFLSDGVANLGTNAAGEAVTACGTKNVTIRTYAIGAGSTCGNGTSNTLAGIAAAKGGTCTTVGTLSALPTIITAIADPKVSAVTGTIDGNPAPPGTITTTPALPAGSVSYTWNVTGLSPGDHTLCVKVSGFDIGGSGDATECRTITVAQAIRTVSVGDVTVNEGAGTASFTVSLDAATGVAASVGFATGNGTATAGSDYTATSQTVNFAAGESTKSVTVPITDDNVYEGSESFNVTLSGAVNLTIGDGAGVGTITDNEGPPTITITPTPNTPGQTGTPGSPNVSINEGNAGCSTVSLSINLTGPSSAPVTVNYSTGGGTATVVDDYTAATGSVTFAPGETSKTVTVCVKGDTLDEPDETFNLTATSPNGNATSVVTIIDDDLPPTISITPTPNTPGQSGTPGSPNVTVTEGDGPGCSTVSLTINLSGPSLTPVTVSYATGGGTATSGADYTAATGSVTFAPGETSKTVTVCVKGDVVDEPNETFNLTATTPNNGNATSVVTISDDDIPVTLSVNDVTVTEGDSGTTNATFTVTRSRASGEAISLKWATGNGSAPVATAGTDYTAGSGTVAFAASEGALTKTFAVAVKGDLVDEPNETFNVTLSALTGGTATFARSVGIGTIKDDDRSGGFSCAGNALALGDTAMAGAANTPYSPCKAQTVSVLNLPLNLLVSLNAKVVSSTTKQTPVDTVTTDPAVNDAGTADSSVANVKIVIAGHTITADAVTSHAEARCVAPLGGTPALSGSTTLVNLRIDGKPVVLVNGKVSIVLDNIVRVYINQTVVSGANIIQRAIYVEGDGILTGVKVRVAEAKAGYTGNPCSA